MATDPSQVWYLELKGQKTGPFSAKQLEERLNRGEIQGSDRVTTPRLQDRWIRLDELLRAARGESTDTALTARPPEMPPKGSGDSTNPALTLFDTLQAARDRRTKPDSTALIETPPPPPAKSSRLWILLAASAAALGATFAFVSWLQGQSKAKILEESTRSEHKAATSTPPVSSNTEASGMAPSSLGTSGLYRTGIRPALPPPPAPSRDLRDTHDSRDRADREDEERRRSAGNDYPEERAPEADVAPVTPPPALEAAPQPGVDMQQGYHGEGASHPTMAPAAPDTVDPHSVPVPPPAAPLTE